MNRKGRPLEEDGFFIFFELYELKNAYQLMFLLAQRTLTLKVRESCVLSPMKAHHYEGYKLKESAS
jgi:hypothetical protein